MFTPRLRARYSLALHMSLFSHSKSTYVAPAQTPAETVAPVEAPAQKSLLSPPPPKVPDRGAAARVIAAKRPVATNRLPSLLTPAPSLGEQIRSLLGS